MQLVAQLEGLPQKSCLKPPYLTINKKLILGVCYKRNVTKTTTTSSEVKQEKTQADNLRQSAAKKLSLIASDATKNSLTKLTTQNMQLKQNKSNLSEKPIFDKEVQVEILKSASLAVAVLPSITLELMCGKAEEKLTNSCHIMCCPLKDCGIKLCILDFVAHIYRMHEDLPKRAVLRGDHASFEMHIYPDKSFQAAIIMLKPVSGEGAYDVTNPFWPLVLMGNYITVDDLEYFMIWLQGVNDTEAAAFSMTTQSTGQQQKRLQSFIFDVRQNFSKQEIFQSRQALVFTLDEIKSITKYGAVPLRFNIRMVH